MNAHQRRIVIVRHAKAEQYAAEDRKRVLTERGARDATEVGTWLASVGAVPDYALVSSAARTVQTWELIAVAAGSSAEVVYDDSLYSGSAEVVIEVLRGAPLDAAVVAFVGHNPTAASLAHMLDDGQGDEQAFRSMSAGYPTSAVTVLDVSVPWDELEVATASIRAYHVGRGETLP